MTEVANEVPAAAVAPVETVEKKEKKAKKVAEPEPEFYIPLEEREKAFEETKHLFDPSIKKKSKKRATAGEGASAANGGGNAVLLVELRCREPHAHEGGNRWRSVLQVRRRTHLLLRIIARFWTVCTLKSRPTIPNSLDRRSAACRCPRLRVSVQRRPAGSTSWTTATR